MTEFVRLLDLGLYVVEEDQLKRGQLLQRFQAWSTPRCPQPCAWSEGQGFRIPNYVRHINDLTGPEVQFRVECLLRPPRCARRTVSFANTGPYSGLKDSGLAVRETDVGETPARELQGLGGQYVTCGRPLANFSPCAVASRSVPTSSEHCPRDRRECSSDPPSGSENSTCGFCIVSFGCDTLGPFEPRQDPLVMHSLVEGCSRSNVNGP